MTSLLGTCLAPGSAMLAGRWRALAVGLAAAAAGCKSSSNTPLATSGSSAPGDATAKPPDAGAAPVASQLATWTCTASPCPWGASLNSQVIAWPAAAGAITTRLGYTVSAGVYLPAAQANGADITIATGEAIVHAGLPGDMFHRQLATIAAGKTFHVSGLGAGEVLSVQAEAPFTYRATLPPPGTAEPPRTAEASRGVAEPARTGPTPTGTEPAHGAAEPAHGTAAAPHGTTAPPRKPTAGAGSASGPARVMHATRAIWRCNNTPGCFSNPWPGAVITWPEWSAYQSNGRSGNVLRFVYTPGGAPLHPYMGAWAQGCEVTAESGRAKVVEWKRGAEAWRETVLEPGQSHVIDLVPPEDGALIESPDEAATFRVAVRNCTPQRIAP